MKKLIKKMIFHPLAILVITLIALAIVIGSRRNLGRLSLAQQNLKMAQDKVESLENEVRIMEEKVDKSNQPLAKEQLIRDKLLQQVEGERVIKLPEVVANNDQVAENEKKEVWEEWWELVR